MLPTKLQIARVIFDGWRSFRSWRNLPSVYKMEAHNDAVEADVLAGKVLPEDADLYSSQDFQNKRRLLSWWGWVSEPMLEHWDRYFADPSYHNRKNIGSEHARLDAQRAYKMYSYLIVEVAIYALGGGIVLGIIITVVTAFVVRWLW